MHNIWWSFKEIFFTLKFLHITYDNSFWGIQSYLNSRLSEGTAIKIFTKTFQDQKVGTTLVCHYSKHRWGGTEMDKKDKKYAVLYFSSSFWRSRTDYEYWTCVFVTGIGNITLRAAYLNKPYSHIHPHKRVFHGRPHHGASFAFGAHLPKGAKGALAVAGAVPRRNGSDCECYGEEPNEGQQEQRAIPLPLHLPATIRHYSSRIMPTHKVVNSRCSDRTNLSLI